MTVIGRTNRDSMKLPAAAVATPTLGGRFDRWWGAFMTSLCCWLCAASRGYLCCPESCHERLVEDGGCLKEKKDEDVPGK
jgi:hypothetical protein